MFRTVVVPLDGSRFGEHALPYALSLARRTGASVHVVHVYESLFDGVEGYGPLDQKGLSDAQTYLSQATQKLAGSGNVVGKLLQGSVASTLHDYAQQVNADLIVMTTHGRGRMARFWLGSVTDKLVRKMPVPLLLVRPGDTEPDWKKDMVFEHVLVALDGSPFAEKVLDPLAVFGKVHQCNFTLLQVISPTMLQGEEPLTAAVSGLDPMLVQQLETLQAQKRKNVEAYLRRVSEQWSHLPGRVQTCIVEHLQPANAILEQAQSQHADVIAMATHGRGGFSRLFLGSIADKVLRGTNLPVFVYHPPAA